MMHARFVMVPFTELFVWHQFCHRGRFCYFNGPGREVLHRARLRGVFLPYKLSATIARRVFYGI
jgi:hypothetical protein